MIQILKIRLKKSFIKSTPKFYPVGTNVENLGYAMTCSFCDEVEDEFHLFLTSPRVIDVWTWLQNSVLCHFFNTQQFNQLTAWEKLIGFNDKIPTSILRVWKLIHCMQKPFKASGPLDAKRFLMTKLLTLWN
jgi:hypothetical protein